MRLELLAWGVTLLLEGFIFQDLLQGRASFFGDTLNFGFPYFSYFAESVIKGHLPYWDYFTHGGHPFYPMIGISRLLDPITLAVIYFGKFFTGNLLVLFNWNILILGFICQLGLYLFIRSLVKPSVVRALWVPVIVFSSVTFSSFWHVASLYYFIWIPYIAYFLNRVFFVQTSNRRDWTLLLLFLCLQCQGYFLTSAALYIFLYAIGLLFFHRETLRKTLWPMAYSFKGLLWLSALMGALLQTLVLALERGKYIYPYRMKIDDFINFTPNSLTSQVAMSYDYLAQTGAPSVFMNFFWLVYPNLIWHGAEVFMWFGVVAWFLATLGIFFGNHPQKKLFFFLLVATGLLILGAPGGFHALLYYVFPPIRYIRHVMELTNLFLLGFVFFSALGCEVARQVWTGERKILLEIGHWIWPAAFTAYLTVGAIFLIRHYSTPYSVALFALMGALLAIVVQRKVGRGGLWLVTLLFPLVCAGWYCKNWGEFTLYLGIVLLLPVALFLVFKRRPTPQRVALLCIVTLIGTGFTTATVLKRFQSLYSRNSELEKVGAKIQLGDKPIEWKRFVSPYKYQLIAEEPLAVPAISTRTLSLFNNNSSFSIERGLEVRILTHFLMSREFFQLFRSGLSNQVLKEVFSLEKSVFQFKPQAHWLPKEEILPYLKSLKDAGPLEGAFVTDDLTYRAKNFAPSVPPHAEIHLESFTPNEVRLTVDTKKAGFLYWADGFDPDWSAWVNGEKIPVIRANLNSKAVEVKKGKNQIRFSYFPMLYVYSIFIFGGILIILTGLSLVQLKNYKPKPAPTPKFRPKANSLVFE